MVVKMGMALFGVLLLCVVAAGDDIDVVTNLMQQVDASNCASKSLDELTLPVYTSMVKKPSMISEAESLALNRALLYSITNQRLNTSREFYKQPDFYYTYLSTAVSLQASSQAILATGLYYDEHTYYANFYYSLSFNMTLKLFAPYATRDLDTVNVKDDSLRDYTTRDFKTGEWFSTWLPDQSYSYHNKEVLRVTDSEWQSQEAFFVAGSHPPPVLVTQQPYFDCGRTNRWVVTASSPIVDFLPRYTFFIHLRKPRFVAVSTVDVDFTAIDINQCDFSGDNPHPNSFAGTHRCKPSTKCKPLRGHGFSRGGYECVCRRPGWVYTGDGPYQGRDVEAATDDEYEAGFDCVFDPSAPYPRTDFTPSTPECTSDAPAAVMPDIGDEGLREFYTEVRPALRLSQFLSGYFQQEPEALGENFLVQSPRQVNQQQIESEVEALVLSGEFVLAAEVVLEMEDGEIYSYYVRGGSVTGYDLDVREDHWTAAMLEARRGEVWSGYSSGEQMTVNSRLRPIPGADQLEDVPAWTFTAPTLTGTHRVSEYSCVFNAWVLNVSFPILGFDDQSNVVVRGEISLVISK